MVIILFYYGHYYGHFSTSDPTFVCKYSQLRSGSYLLSNLRSRLCNFNAQYSKLRNVLWNIHNELGTRAVKSDVKSTVIKFYYIKYSAL